nr:immunoglobulin light chain junction region [Macaca mulatta]MOW62974.1 immunoglobulin light chain junction region [Macaca mulatta]MOW65004.1 immunoglobulin light chain junction region [Macaca mulatta]
CGQGIHLTF